MVPDYLCVHITLSVFFGCFRCAQALYNLLHLHCKNQSIRITLNGIYQLPVFFPIQGFCHVIRSIHGPAHPSVLHPQGDRCTILILLYPMFLYTVPGFASGIFIPCSWYGSRPSLFFARYGAILKKWTQ